MAHSHVWYKCGAIVWALEYIDCTMYNAHSIKYEENQKVEHNVRQVQKASTKRKIRLYGWHTIIWKR